MAKKMTPDDRAIRYATESVPKEVPAARVFKTVQLAYLAGWRARGRADALTNAERAVIEAAEAFIHNRNAATLGALAAAVYERQSKRSAK